MAIKTPPVMEEGETPCENANKALTYAIIGIFCFGVVMGPMAVAKAIEARKEIRADARLCGLGKANIGLLLGVAVLILWVLGMISRVKSRM